MSILEVNNIEKHYGSTKVLKDISFELEEGVVGLFYDWCLNSCLSVEYLRLSLSESHFENVFAWAASSVGYAGFSLDFRWFSFEC